VLAKPSRPLSPQVRADQNAVLALLDEGVPLAKIDTKLFVILGIEPLPQRLLQTAVFKFD